MDVLIFGMWLVETLPGRDESNVRHGLVRGEWIGIGSGFLRLRPIVAKHEHTTATATATAC